VQEVRTKAPGRRSKLTKDHTQMTSAASGKAYGAGNMFADNRLQVEIRLSDAEKEATTWNLADTE